MNYDNNRHNAHNEIDHIFQDLFPARNMAERPEQAALCHRMLDAMLEVNRAIAQATERGYKISKLRTNGLLDADACAAQMAANTAQLTQLRAKRRRLLKNDDIGEAAEALRWAVENGIINGYGDGRLGPQGLATRGQVAQMLKNFLGK